MSSLTMSSCPLQRQQQQQRSTRLSKSFVLVVFVIAIQMVTAKSLQDTQELNYNSEANRFLTTHQHAGYHHHQQSLHHQHHQHDSVDGDNNDIDDNHPHHRRRLQRRNSEDYKNAANANSGTKPNSQQCENVRDYFNSIHINLDGNYAEKGSTCGGNCCSNSTESLLRQKAKSEFESLLHHHTSSLRGILESTADLFQKHIIELTEQSENKTLNVFSQVYRRMVPLSRKLIHELYSEIMSHLRNSHIYSSNGIQNLNSLEDAIHRFFVNLFPVAYHQAVHISKENYGELHEDYINCLKHTFDELQPFGTIPKDIKRNLLQSIQTATIFMSTLMQSSEVLGETNDLYATHLTDTCQKHLLKMSYCPSCHGMHKPEVKACYSYCMNVLRGCSAQYAKVLDSPWSNVVDAIDNLVTNHIRSDSGIVTTIKQLDGKLSETIMRAMENGPELEKKVKKTCGTPKLLPSLAAEEIRPMPQHTTKWATPPDTEILRFLSTIDKSKDFYSNIVNNVCEDEDIQGTDHNCWTGDRIGDYNQLVMTTGVDTQRYNPEVPLEPNSQSTNLNELMDKLIKIRKNIGTAIPTTTRIHSDIQSDMARHDEEGSGHWNEDLDDEEFDNMHGSGDGSGDDDTTPPTIDGAEKPPIITTNDIESRGSTAALAYKSTTISITTLLGTFIITLVTILLRRNS